MAHLKELALFAGAGGGILGGKLLGWRTVCAVEINAYCREVLMRRQDEGHLEPFPIWDDVRTFDGTEWRGKVDVISGGFPCQDVSSANSSGAGIDGERSGLWREFARIIGEVRPSFAFVENSPALLRRGFDKVIGDLAAIRYDAHWGVFSACAVGAPHTRERMFILAYPESGRARQLRRIARAQKGATERYVHWSLPESGIDRKVDGLAGVVDRLRAIGNGQVPAVAAAAWRILGGP